MKGNKISEKLRNLMINKVVNDDEGKVWCEWRLRQINEPFTKLFCRLECWWMLWKIVIVPKYTIDIQSTDHRITKKNDVIEVCGTIELSSRIKVYLIHWLLNLNSNVRRISSMMVKNVSKNKLKHFVVFLRIKCRFSAHMQPFE